MDNLRAELFKHLKHVVIKVGTKILITDKGKFNHKRVNALVEDICELKSKGYSVVLVSSGAVGLGMGSLGLTKRPRQIAQEQACAAIGQIELMEHYSKKFSQKKQKVAQILLSAEDFQIRSRYTNITHTVKALLDQDIIPIINENDSITTDELKVGDNDKLSSDVAHFLNADLLILVSVAGALYPKNPMTHKNISPISVVPKITPEIKAMGGGAGSENSVGGMRAKLKAVEQATLGGVAVVLTDGKKNALPNILAGKKTGTLFIPNKTKLKGRRRWIAFISGTKGKIRLDEGALVALQSGKSSLLPSGIVSVTGKFKSGAFVDICSSKGAVRGRGRVHYSAVEIADVIGLKSREAVKKINREVKEEVIHRDDLVMY